MDSRKLSQLINKAGVSAFEIEAFGHIPFTKEQLTAFATSIIEECAQVQTDRSKQRHGYDKYSDGDAIRNHFDGQTNSSKVTDENVDTTLANINNRIDFKSI